MDMHATDWSAVDANVQRYSKTSGNDVGLLHEHHALRVSFVDSLW